MNPESIKDIQDHIEDGVDPLHVVYASFLLHLLPLKCYSVLNQADFFIYIRALSERFMNHVGR